MKSTLGVFLVILLSSFFVQVLANDVNGGCPFKSSEKPKTTTRGHKEPFGYHAKQWKRIETLYEHPHPEVFYEKFMRASKPVIIRGGAKHWPAINKWTNLTYLSHQSRFGRPDINWKKLYSYDPFHPVRVRMTMKEFTRNFDKHNLYMDATLPSEIADDVHWPKSLSCRFYQKRTKQLAIMFNNGKSSSDLHMDSTCTYFVQVTGSRRWLLTPPTEVANVYSGTPSLVDHLGVSIVDQNFVDIEKHQRVQDLTIYGAIMGPGDIIYVPEGWHHQVKTYNSPNIGVVVFLNYLMCEFHSNTDEDDIIHVNKCVYKIREQRPSTLKCDAFPEEKLTIPQLLKKHPPPSPDSFMQPFERPSLEFGVPNRIMKSGKQIYPMGVSLVGYDGHSQEREAVIPIAMTEGFRMFCVSSADHSPQLLGDFLKKSKKFRARTKIIAFLPPTDHGKNNAKGAIDNLLKSMNTTKIHMMLLQADYCPSVNGTEPCDRDTLTQEMIDTWKVMEDAYRNGMFETIGVSDLSLKELQKLQKISEIPISIARARFDPFFRNKEYRNYCRENKIVFMGRSILGKRWNIERPDFPLNRDIVKEYCILRASFQYRTSVYSVTYDFAVRKGVIICPPLTNELHVRVTAQGFRSESGSNPDNLQNIDECTDETDQGLFSPGFKNYLPKEDGGNEGEDEADIPNKVEAGKEEMLESGEIHAAFNKQYETMSKFELDFSKEVYTDHKDFEKFPDFMKVKDPFKKV